MENWIAALLGLIVGALAAAGWLRSTYAARLASARTEAEVLRERVVDLEATLGDDRETAAALAPLGAAMRRVEQQVGTLERDRVEQFGSLAEALTRVELGTGELGRATAHLAGALRSSSVRGAWGEVQLRRVLEVSGLLPRCDFDEQVRLTGRDGQSLRPDVVVRLPGEKSLVVDAKAPLEHFLDAQAEGVADSRRQHLLGLHARALRAHVQVLAGREYWSALRGSPEVVVLFVPSEAMLAAALAHDPGLHEWALDRRVAVVGPGALLALLRTVAHTWRQDSLTESAQQLLDLGRELHQRLGTLGQHVGRLGRSLQGSVEAYNSFVGTLEARVLVSARRMEGLGVVSGTLDSLAAVEVGPRVLTAPELLDSPLDPADAAALHDAVAAEAARPELLLPHPPASAADEHRPTG